ncbi:Chitin synthase regulatory factor 4, partial [Grifola frondosa]
KTLPGGSPHSPPLPPDFKPDQFQSPPHFEDPLVAPRPHKLQPDLPANFQKHSPISHSKMARSLDEQAAQMPSYRPGEVVLPPVNSISHPFVQSPYFPHQHSPNQAPSFPVPGGPISRGPSPLPPPQGSDWSPWLANQPPSTTYPAPYSPNLHPRAQHQPSLSFCQPRVASPPQAAVTTGPPSLTAPLPSVSVLSSQLAVVQQPSYDPARKVVWCRDVLSLVDRAQQLIARTNSTSADPAIGPARIDDPELQRLVNVAVSLVLQISSPQPPQSPIPLHVAEAIYLRASAESTGAYPKFIGHNPRIAFRDFEQAAKAGYHSSWFKLGRDYENFGDVVHAKDCFERGMKYGIESCIYRMGMANLMGQLNCRASPEAALPLLNRAATLATVDVPQPAYVYGLLLLDEFSHVSIPPQFFAPFIPPGSSPQAEARRHLERAAYLNFSPAQYKLGHAYEFATPPFPFDALLSVQYYSLASQQGEIEADMALSKWFLCGAEGAFEKDEALAWTFAEKAALKGLPSAEFALGYYSEVGVGGPKDIDAARKWYTKAANHGNTDASERLQALSQPSPQALSREQHENLADVTLVRKRTQAKQRSQAIPGASALPVPAAQSQRIVNNIRKNSLIGGPAGPRHGGLTAAGASAGFSSAVSSSPPQMGIPASLPPVEGQHPPRRPISAAAAAQPGTVPQQNPTSPRMRPASSQSPAQARPFANATRYSLVDPGSGTQSPSHSPPASTTPLRPHGRPQSKPSGGPAPPQGPSAEPAADSPPQRPPTRGPQTFAEMGIATQKAEDDSNCVIM